MMPFKKCPYPVFNRQEAADYLGFSLSWLEKLVSRKKLTSHKKGKCTIFFLTDLEEYEKEEQTF